ncbi:MAG TPA: hypothetical protein VFP56_11270 [Candidatus Limnocylindrales bacterium]|nr:hypothetical protein [Candidatus Limnocylindrales bacterium]
MGPLLLGAAGVLALGVAIAILRSFGPRYRVGRLLAVVPQIPIAEAVALAERGETRYVRVDGRIDSDAEFEDDAHRPLVLRRTTIQWRPSPTSGAWRAAADPDVQLATFVIREGLDEIGVDATALGPGLVVVPRMSVGKVADLGTAAPQNLPADAAARLVIEHVSSVEHATVLGVPARGPDGRTVLGAGLGRPLILTTLERDEAMRVLTGGAAGRSRVAIAGLAIGAALIAAAAIWWLLDALFGNGVAAALAASPDPTLRPGTDIRSGDAAGFMGEPLLAILGVAALGVASLLATLAWVRFTGGRARR